MLPDTPARSLFDDLGLPGVFGGSSGTDHELYEADGEYVVTAEMPGFERDEIDVRWHDGTLTIAGEHEDEELPRRRRYHRTFRFPKAVDDEAIQATYTNGVLEVRIPLEEAAQPRGREIPVEG